MRGGLTGRLPIEMAKMRESPALKRRAGGGMG